MKYKRLKLCVIILCGVGVLGIQAQTMYVNRTIGQQTAYALNNIRKMTFSGESLYIQKTDFITNDFALSGLKHLIFESITSGINVHTEVIGDDVIFYPNVVRDVLNIDLKGVKSQGVVSVLTFEGKVLLSQKTKGAVVVSLSLSYLPKGLYLCHYSNETKAKTVKIIKL